MAETLFYLVSAGAVACGIGVIAARSPLTSVLSLLGTFVCLAVVYLLAGFQFLAAAQILVYAGAILVLFLFVVMLLDLDQESAHPERPGAGLGPRRLALAGGISAVLVAAGTLSVGLAGAEPPDPAVAAGPIDDIESVAALLFSRYMLPFEAASLLLLATMVGVIVLAKRQRSGPASAASPTGYPYRTPRVRGERGPTDTTPPPAPLPDSPAQREEVNV